MQRDFLRYENLDLVYTHCLINCAADAFVKGTKFERFNVLLGMLNKITIDDYRNAVAKRGGNGEAAVDGLFAAHQQALRFKFDLEEGAAVMARLAAAPADEHSPVRHTFDVTLVRF